MNVGRLNVRSAAQRVLVTGGCGFLGCNIAAVLAARGRSVLVVDNLSRAGAQENAEWLTGRHGNSIGVEVADVRDADAVRRVVTNAAAVMHLAGQVAVTTSVENPVDDFEVNCRGTINVLEAVRRHNPQAPVIFASTNKVYGKLLEEHTVTRIDGGYTPDQQRFACGVAEDAPLDLHSPYGCSKGAADQYVHDYARVYGLRTVVLRMSCIYGPRQFGTEDQGWIAHFLLQAIRGRPITIYGDGYQVRDALYVADAAEAWIKALDQIDSVRGQIFNLGGGPANSVSLRQMIDFITDLRGKAPELRFAEWRPGDQPWYVSDIRSISRALDWQPRMPLRQGLRELERWLAARFSDVAPVTHLQEARA